jgi:hypothetical protein
MAYRLGAFAGVLDEALLRVLLARQDAAGARLGRLWGYYRNAPLPASASCATRRRVRLAQVAGLPARLTGPRDAMSDDRAAPPEVVIENDIAWRVHAMVDFMFGKPVVLLSTARDPATRRRIERVLDAIWEASGGIALLQDMALLGHVYGHVDLLLRRATASGRAEAARRGERGGPGGGRPRRLRAPDPGPPLPGGGDDEALLGAARDLVRIEVVEPTRGIPVMNAADYRELDAYIVRFRRELNEVDRSLPARGAALLSRLTGGEAPGRPRRSEFLEILSAHRRQVYEDGALVEDDDRPLTPGRLPMAHIQNIAQPFRYEGLSEVEPLIPLQDELNTRLSDRASRVTLQSFKMYLMKGLGEAGSITVAPGTIWTSDDPRASVEAFGGDAHCPSEEAHIQEIREALDKQSGIPPLASGVVRAKIGNLTSANALRITLMGVLSKTARKRITYGRGIAAISSLILAALDHAGILATDERDRGVKLHWPDPLPEDLREQAEAARLKADLGVPRERLLAELGAAPDDPGVT